MNLLKSFYWQLCLASLASAQFDDCTAIYSLWTQVGGDPATFNDASDTNCCGHDGVSCDATRVVAIAWIFQPFTTTLPDVIGDLTGLTSLLLICLIYKALSQIQSAIWSILNTFS